MGTVLIKTPRVQNRPHSEKSVPTAGTARLTGWTGGGAVGSGGACPGGGRGTPRHDLDGHRRSEEGGGSRPSGGRSPPQTGAGRGRRSPVAAGRAAGGMSRWRPEVLRGTTLTSPRPRTGGGDRRRSLAGGGGAPCVRDWKGAEGRPEGTEALEEPDGGAGTPKSFGERWGCRVAQSFGGTPVPGLNRPGLSHGRLFPPRRGQPP